MKLNITGNLLAIFAFILWGILPLYFKQLSNTDIFELLAIRIIFSVPIVLLTLKLFHIPQPPIKAILKEKQSLLLCLLAGLMGLFSLWAFTSATKNGDILAASLGYFINPLCSIALAIIILGERLSRAKKVAVILAILGISYQVYSYGELPFLSLIMGSAFALYGLIKKFIKFDSFISITLEVILWLPFALAYMAWLYWRGESQFFCAPASVQLLYIGMAPVVLAPLILFSFALNRASLSSIGLTQYIEPSLQFLIAVILFGEVFDQVKLVSFGFIWLGLFLCLLESAKVMTIQKRIVTE